MSVDVGFPTSWPATATTHHVTRPEFEHLARWEPTTDADVAVSAYVPLESGGLPHAATALRSLAHDARRRLVACGTRQEVADDLVAPVLTAAGSLGQLQRGPDHARGLAVFAAAGVDVVVWLRTEPPMLVTCSDRFTVTPLVGSLPVSGAFDLLALSQHRLRLYHGDADGLHPLRLRGLPGPIESALPAGAHRSESHGRGPVGRGSIAFGRHGSGSFGDRHDERLHRYFRLVDDVVRAFSSVSRRPLLVVGTGDDLAIYRAASRMSGLEIVAIGSTDHLYSNELHSRCASAIADVLDRPRQRALRTLNRAPLVTSLPDVLAACAEARVDTLFVRPDRLAWTTDGTPTADTPSPTCDRELHSDAISAALKQGAAVLPAWSGELPPESSVAALLRY